jgi:hypothetical protein
MGISGASFLLLLDRELLQTTRCRQFMGSRRDDLWAPAGLCDVGSKLLADLRAEIAE